MVTEFRVGGFDYRCAPLSTFKQLTLCRKTAPIFVHMGQDLHKVASGEVPLDSLGERIVVLLASISEEDLTIAINTLLPYIERKGAVGIWSPVYIEQAQAFQFEDITGGDLLEILFRVLNELLPPFYSAVNRAAFGSPQTATTDTQP